MKIWKTVIAIVLTVPMPIKAQDSSMGGRISGNGRDLFIACYLFLADAKIENQVIGEGMVLPYSPPACLTTQIAMASNAPQGKDNGNLGCWKIPKTPEATANWPRELARLYVRTYEKNAEKFANVMGITALFLVARSEWPCE